MYSISENHYRATGKLNNDGTIKITITDMLNYTDEVTLVKHHSKKYTYSDLEIQTLRVLGRKPTASN